MNWSKQFYCCSGCMLRVVFRLESIRPNLKSFVDSVTTDLFCILLLRRSGGMTTFADIYHAMSGVVFWSLEPEGQINLCDVIQALLWGLHHFLLKNWWSHLQSHNRVYYPVCTGCLFNVISNTSNEESLVRREQSTIFCG